MTILWQNRHFFYTHTSNYGVFLSWWSFSNKILYI